MSFLLSLLFFMILLGVVVVVHELGHLIIARANGVFCEAFSFGFGPVLFSRKDKKGTDWRFSAFPLGGYVKMLGDADVSSVREIVPEGYTEEDMERMSAHRKKPWQRLLIAAGGPFANFIFAILVLFSLGIINGTPEYTNEINVVNEECLANEAGLKSGDAIVKANGFDIHNFEDLKKQITNSKGKELSLEIKRDDEIKNINIKMFKEENGEKKPISVIGITPFNFTYKPISILEAAKSAVVTTYTLASENIKAIFKIATSKMSAKNVGGIISIFKISTSSAESGVISFILMIAMISTVLGAVNLLPIPVLDGGSIVISAIEWIIGKPLNKKFIEAIFMIGFTIIIGLMVLGIWNDLSNCKFFSWLENLFK